MRRIDCGLKVTCPMSYSIDDLSLFDSLASPDEREGTAYFELYPKELPYPNACWLPDSFFIRDAAFDFFAECFHSASKSFDYFSFQRFGAPEISRLIHELDIFLRDLSIETSREKLFSRYASIINSGIWSQVDSQILLPAVRGCGERMVAFVQSTTRESNCLWVLGM